jgi:hypothetical protein
MSSKFTFEEVLNDARAFVSAEHYPPFQLAVYENDGGVGILINRKPGTGEPGVVAISPDDALRIAKALQEAAALARR